jgi:hypothetical protein
MRVSASLIALLLAPAAVSAQVARITVTPANPKVISGDSLQLTAVALDAAGKPVPNVTIRFQQSAAKFEGVTTPEGMVKAGGPSVLPINVTAVVAGQKPFITKVEVTVLPGAAASIALAPKISKLVAGQSFRVGAQVLSGIGDSRGDKVTWTSSAPTVAKVGTDGTISGVGAGKTTITAAVGAVKSMLAVEVVTQSIANLTISPSQPNMRTGDVVKFRLTAKDAAGKEIKGLTPSWFFSPGQGAIDENGAFVGYDAGTYTVTAQLGNQNAQTSVTLTARDVRRPAKIVGQLVRTTFPTSEVWVHPNGKVAYLGTHLGGDRVYVLDVADSSKPTIVDSVIVNARVINDVMTSEDGKVMVITREGADNRKNGIVILTLDDPLHPKVVSEFTDGVTAGVHSSYIYTQPKYGRHIYITNDGTGQLHIIDINDPAKPKLVATWAPPRVAGRSLHDIDVRDGMLYGAWWNDGLIVLDIGSGIKGGSPSNPQFVTQYKYDLNAMYKQVGDVDGPGFVRGTHTAWRHKNWIFIADEVFANSDEVKLFKKEPARAYGRLQVLDATDIFHLKSVAFYEPEYGGVHNVWVAGDTLYMGAYNAGFRAFDISGDLRGNLSAQQREIANVNPVSMQGFIPNSTMTWGVVVKNGIAYVNDFNTGLFLVKIEPKPGVVP